MPWALLSRSRVRHDTHPRRCGTLTAGVGVAVGAGDRPISDLHLLSCGSGGNQGILTGAGGALSAPTIGGAGMWPQGNGGSSGGGGGGGEASVYQQACGAVAAGGLLAVNCYDNILRVYERLAPQAQALSPPAPPTPSSAASLDPMTMGGEVGSAIAGTGGGGARRMVQQPEMLNQRPLFHLQVVQAQPPWPRPPAPSTSSSLTCPLLSLLVRLSPCLHRRSIGPRSLALSCRLRAR